MNSTSFPLQSTQYNIALWLALITIGYNVVEGVLSTWWGFEDETLALFGFGADSFVEVISGIGIVHLVIRLKRNPATTKDQFEKTALKITGTAFYLLVTALIISSAIIVYTKHTPVTTYWGVVIAIISIVTMMALMYGKTRIGKKLQSEAILADAACTKVCIYMSVILLLSSGIYEITHLPYVDAGGTLGLAYFSYKEGKECFEKARGKTCCSC